MICNIGTIFNLSDNSGLKKLKNINILTKNKKLKINNILAATIKKGKNLKLKLKKSDIVYSIIVCSKKYNSEDSYYISFNKNSTILLDNQKKINCTKIKGLISSMVKDFLYKSKINCKKAKFI